MQVSDLFPKDGHVQRLYCDNCNGYLDLAYTDFIKFVSEIYMEVIGLPILKCTSCAEEFLPDRSRFAIIELHRRAMENGSNTVSTTRKKPIERFNFCNVNFDYDSDDYYYLPGLERQFDKGFLTPVFFNSRVLYKYDSVPGYRLQFASTTYGSIVTEDDSMISFGINRNGHVVMWLGDIEKLPENEQHYLKSENIQSDHSVGSEFYDGQIECKFTDPPVEGQALAARTALIEAVNERFGVLISHLDSEVVAIALELKAPLVDTEKERKAIADNLNRVFVEALSDSSLKEIIRKLGISVPNGTRNLKRLQLILATLLNDDSVAAALMSPLFVLYDLRVAYSHLLSDEKKNEVINSVTDRLGLPENADIFSIHNEICTRLKSSLIDMKSAVDRGS